MVPKHMDSEDVISSDVMMGSFFYAKPGKRYETSLIHTSKVFEKATGKVTTQARQCHMIYFSSLLVVLIFLRHHLHPYHHLSTLLLMLSQDSYSPSNFQSPTYHYFLGSLFYPHCLPDYVFDWDPAKRTQRWVQ